MLLAYAVMFAADVTPSDPWGLAGTVINACGFGVLVWYLLTKQIPKMNEQFSKDLEAERADKMKLMRFVLAIAGAAMTSPAIGNNPAVQEALGELSKVTTKDAM